MEIQLESSGLHAIQSYSESDITIQQITYDNSLILTESVIQTDWPVHSITELTTESIQTLLTYQPEIILVGHSEPSRYLSPAVRSYLSQNRIGIECMNVGAACRTFNVLLSEHRVVVLGYIRHLF